MLNLSIMPMELEHIDDICIAYKITTSSQQKSPLIIEWGFRLFNLKIKLIQLLPFQHRHRVWDLIS